MRRIAGLVVLGFGLACFGGSEDAAVEAPPVAVEAPTPEPVADVRYVWASSLNLRAGSDPASSVQGVLTINSPLSVLDVVDPMAHVRVGNGKEGWVAERFLEGEPLEKYVALTRAGEATDSAEKLAWTQRAAALDPRDTETLRKLAAAYRAVGDEGSAGLVEEQLAWPTSIYVDSGVMGGELWVEVASGWTGFSASGEYPSRLTGAEAAAHGLFHSDTWWVLPDAGPAVKASVASIESHMLNECGGENGLMVKLDATLPAGRIPLAYSRTPPESWHEATPVPTRTRLDVQEAMRDFVGEDGRIDVAWTGSDWTGMVTWETETDTEDWMDPDRVVVHLRMDDGTGAIRETRREDTSGMFVEGPVAERDLDGDGDAEQIWSDHCSAEVRDGSGNQLVVTTFRCCGC